MEIPSLTLKTAPFQFAEFKPLAYQQEVADKNILRQSLNQIEIRRREANAMAEDIATKKDAARALLDPSEFANFDKEFEEVSDRINDMIALGDTGTAIQLANTIGRDMAHDVKWQNKARVKAERDKWLNEAKNSGYSALTLRRMEAENPYYDDGTGDFKHKEYEKDIPLPDIMRVVISNTKVHQSGSSSEVRNTSYGFNKNGKTVSSPIGQGNKIDDNIDLLYKTSTSRGGGINITELKEQDIIDTFKELSRSKEFAGSLRQTFDNLQWLYKEADKVLNDPNSTPDQIKKAIMDKEQAMDGLRDNNGFIINGDAWNEDVYDQWIDMTAKHYASLAAYKHVSTSSSKSNDIDYNVASASSKAAARGDEMDASILPGNTQAGSYEVKLVSTLLGAINGENKPSDAARNMTSNGTK